MQELNEMFHQGYITPFVQEFEKFKENSNFLKENTFKQKKGFFKLSNTLLYANLSMNALFVYIHLCKFTEKVSINDLYLRKYLKSKYNQNISTLALKRAKNELITKNLLQIVKTNYHRINYEWIVRDENHQIIKHFNKDKIQNYLLAKNEALKKDKTILKNQTILSRKNTEKSSQEKIHSKLDFNIFKDNAETKLKNSPQNKVKVSKFHTFSAHAKTRAEKQNRYYIETHACAFPFEKNLIKFKNIIKLSQERKEKEREQENCFSCQSQKQTKLNFFQNTTKQEKNNQQLKNQNIFIKATQNSIQKEIKQEKDIEQMNPQLLQDIKPTPPSKEILLEWLKEYNSIQGCELNHYEVTKFITYYHLKEYKSKNGEYIQNFKNAFFGWLNRAILFEVQNNKAQNAYFTNKPNLNTQNIALNQFYQNNDETYQKNDLNDLKGNFEARNDNFQNNSQENYQILSQNFQNTDFYEADEEEDFYQEQIPTAYGNPRDFMMNDDLSDEEKERLLKEWKQNNPTHTEEYRQEAFRQTLFDIYQRRIAKGDILL